MHFGLILIFNFPLRLNNEYWTLTYFFHTRLRLLRSENAGYALWTHLATESLVSHRILTYLASKIKKCFNTSFQLLEHL